MQIFLLLVDPRKTSACFYCPTIPYCTSCTLRKCTACRPGYLLHGIARTFAIIQLIFRAKSAPMFFRTASLATLDPSALLAVLVIALMTVHVILFLFSFQKLYSLLLHAQLRAMSKWIFLCTLSKWILPRFHDW